MTKTSYYLSGGREPGVRLRRRNQSVLSFRPLVGSDPVRILSGHNGDQLIDLDMYEEKGLRVISPDPARNDEIESAESGDMTYEERM